MKTIQKIFKAKDKSFKMPYIHAFASKMIEMIGSMINEITSSNNLTLSKVKYDLIMIGLENFELLVNLADTEKRNAHILFC